MLNLDTQELCSGLFSDVMDRLGYRKQIITGMQKNNPLISFMGRARTVSIRAMETDDENIRMGLSFLGTVGEGEVLIVNGSDQFAYFGEMMTRMSVRNRIEGIVINGMTRDTNYTHRSDVILPILAKGYSPIDIKGRGRVEAVDIRIVVDGVEICPGNLIYADNEAICVVPAQIEAEVLAKVKEKMDEEKHIVEWLDKGISVKDLLERVKEF